MKILKNICKGLVDVVLNNIASTLLATIPFDLAVLISCLTTYLNKDFKLNGWIIIAVGTILSFLWFASFTCLNLKAKYSINEKDYSYIFNTIETEMMLKSRKNIVYKKMINASVKDKMIFHDFNSSYSWSGSRVNKISLNDKFIDSYDLHVPERVNILTNSVQSKMFNTFPLKGKIRVTPRDEQLKDEYCYELVLELNDEEMKMKPCTSLVCTRPLDALIIRLKYDKGIKINNIRYTEKMIYSDREERDIVKKSLRREDSSSYYCHVLEVKNPKLLYEYKISWDFID